jgi:ferredoxin
VLVAALIIHIVLALVKTTRRKTWHMPRWEAAQILLGLAIPFFLFPHIVNTRVAHQFFDVQDSYLYELVRLWPESAVVQTLLLLIVWVHGCIGIHYWLRLADTYQRLLPILLVTALAVPILAFAGFAVGGRLAGDIMSDPEALAALQIRSNWPNAENGAALSWLRSMVRIAFYSIVAGGIALAISRQILRKISTRPQHISYVDGPTIEIVPGRTLLEHSRAAGLPHASICGGRGRCSTCRVRIDRGHDRLTPANGSEAVTLASIGAPANIRLACQILPVSDLTVAIVSRPDVPGPPQKRFFDFDELVAAHVRGIIAERLVDIASDDPVIVERWLKDNWQDSGTVSDLVAADAELLGARIEYVADQARAAIIYRRRGRLVSIFQSTIDDAAPLAMRGQHSGYHVRTFTARHVTYALVSDLAPQDIDTLVQCLQPATPELKLDAGAAIE